MDGGPSRQPQQQQGAAGSVADAAASSSASGSLSRPNLTYVGLIKEAIVESPERQLYLREIYQSIEDRYPYYREATTTTWKNVIRHCLSITPAFKNVPKVHNAPGKGGLWTIDESIPDAYSRRRVRKSDAGKSSSATRRRSTGSGARAGGTQSGKSEPTALPDLTLSPSGTTWPLDLPPSHSPLMGGLHGLHLQRPPPPLDASWMSPASTYSSVGGGGGGGGAYDRSPSTLSAASDLMPSPLSYTHATPPQQQPRLDGALFGLAGGPYVPPSASASVGGTSPYASPMMHGGFGQYRSFAGLNGAGGGNSHSSSASFSSSYAALSGARPSVPSQSITATSCSAPISPQQAYYSQSLPTPSTAGALAAYGHGQLGLPSALHQAAVHVPPADGGPTAPAQFNLSAYPLPMSAPPLLHVPDAPPAPGELAQHAAQGRGEQTSLGLSISQAHQWRHLPALEEGPLVAPSIPQRQRQQQQQQYAWPPSLAAPFPPLTAEQGGFALSAGAAPVPPVGGDADDQGGRKADGQASEWDAGLRY